MLGRKVAIVRRKGWSGDVDEVCGIAEEILWGCGGKFAELWRKGWEVAEENLRNCGGKYSRVIEETV